MYRYNVQGIMYNKAYVCIYIYIYIYIHQRNDTNMLLKDTRSPAANINLQLIKASLQMIKSQQA